MDLNLKDKVILVSGGAKGIGGAISRGLIEEGAIPVLIDPSEKEGKELVALAGGKALQIPIRLFSPEQAQEVVQTTIKKFGKIDGVVNNAGANDGVGLEHGTPEKFAQSIANNLFHYYHLVHYALPFLKKSKGALVNISSKTAVTGQGGTSGYVAAKGAQLALTREWAVELLPYQIRVNAILPAEVYTPMYESWINSFPNPEEKLQEINRKIPLGKRMTTPEEIASMAIFLLSDKASHITGQHLYVDGGYTHLDRSL
ncbi:3-oxoacyl-[acyl-carrier protein] reductase/L-fucose dehydrogenase [Algoriphagus boseongensis]|uniref:3-oxoacyl-[acyl-carrier protein] reductase/L-fucose dehydrogenase n=1 Tax=Algoriphagus boseongensis TaxID=1442587 RepID=A0A4R6T681_9BACT|nr:SDR family oxidoreductase [Algoriphagus boseongensis]TDQ18440.1 3-oxoacyl-[acyl-carrier protein] reductase/L-fucose dehydrogenase [Algoriphagus boseongensis]